MKLSEILQAGEAFSGQLAQFVSGMQEIGNEGTGICIGN